MRLQFLSLVERRGGQGEEEGDDASFTVSIWLIIGGGSCVDQ